MGVSVIEAKKKTVASPGTLTILPWICPIDSLKASAQNIPIQRTHDISLWIRFQIRKDAVELKD